MNATATNGEPETTAIIKLSADLRKASETLTKREAGFLVSTYYRMQDARIRAGNQGRAMGDEPHALIDWFSDQNETLEKRIVTAMNIYSQSTATGRWSREQHGIGPVLAAGLMAMIDMSKATNPSKIWAYAGLNPTAPKRIRGVKINYKPELKLLCWKIGQSFLKQSGSDKCFYGKLLQERLGTERARNDSGAFSAQASERLATLKPDADKELVASLKSGKLPPGHVLARACRWAVKLFLVHWWQVAYREHYGTEPPKPYVLGILGHADEIKPLPASRP